MINNLWNQSQNSQIFMITSAFTEVISFVVCFLFMNLMSLRIKWSKTRKNVSPDVYITLDGELKPWTRCSFFFFFSIISFIPVWEGLAGSYAVTGFELIELVGRLHIYRFFSCKYLKMFATLSSLRTRNKWKAWNQEILAQILLVRSVGEVANGLLLTVEIHGT